MPAMQKSDPITEELFRNAIAALGDEMVLTIYRTAYSGVLKNIMDYSAALCDGQGRLAAQGLALPGHLCSIPVALQAVLRHFGDDIAEGDILINNDPYDGGMHLPDIFIFKPIFLAGGLSAYACTICHHSDVGGVDKLGCDRDRTMPQAACHPQGLGGIPQVPAAAAQFRRWNCSYLSESARPPGLRRREEGLSRPL